MSCTARTRRSPSSARSVVARPRSQLHLAVERRVGLRPARPGSAEPDPRPTPTAVEHNMSIRLLDAPSGAPGARDLALRDPGAAANADPRVASPLLENAADGGLRGAQGLFPRRLAGVPHSQAAGVRHRRAREQPGQRERQATRPHASGNLHARLFRRGRPVAFPGRAWRASTLGEWSRVRLG
jgi:hypothetical protein